MKNLKKVLALVIALTMVLTTVAFASYPDVDADANYASAVELLSALEILQGDENGNFNPDNTITRAEYAAVVCRALGMENAANSAKGATIFTDVAADHWATGYINLASQQGIVNGKGNGIFDPEGNVTYAEAVKMLVVALGYEPMAASRGGYPTGYLTVANSTKITANVSSSGTDTAALRSTVAQLTANALEVANMDQTGFGTDTKFEVLDDYDNYTTLLTKMDIYKATGVVNSVDAAEGTMELKLTEASDDYEFGYVGSKGDVDPKVALGTATISFDTNGVNVEAYLQQSVDVYVYKAGKSDYDVVYITASGVGSTLRIDADDLATGKATIGTSRSTVEYYENSDATKTTKIDVEAKAPVYFNNYLITNADSYTAMDLATLLKDTGATVDFVENTDDKYYDRVLITVYNHGIVEDVETARERINFVGGDSIKFDSADKNQVVTLQDKDGNAMKLEDIKEKDVLAMVVEVNSVPGITTAGSYKEPVAKNFASNGNKITITDLGANAVTGKLDQSDDAKSKIYIDGTDYEVGAFVDGNSSKVYKTIYKADGTVDGYEAKLDTEGTFYLDINGKVIGFDGTTGGSANYGYILQAEYNTSNSFDSGWEVKMLTKDGIVTYKLYKTFEFNGTSETSSNLTNTYAALAPFQKATATAAAAAAAAPGTTPVEYFKYLPANRVCEYKITTDNELKSIDVYKGSAVDTVSKDSEFKESTGKLDGKTLANDVVIFNLDGSDVDDGYAMDISSLVDEGEYTGIVADKDSSEWNVFVITTGQAAYNKEEGAFVVESVRKSTLGNQDSYNVTYYSKGETEKKTAIFTDDSTNKGSVAYSNLKKGDLFVANMNSENVVNDYIVLAQVSNTGFVVNGAFAAAYKNDFSVDNGLNKGVDYIYGYIKKIDGRNGNKILEIVKDSTGAVETVTIEKSTNAYSYTSAKNTIVDSGDWYTDTVDDAETLASGKIAVTPVFVRMYDGLVIDVYTFNNRVETTNATFAFKNSANAKTNASTTSTKTEVKEDVKDETPVVEVPVAEEDFE